MKKFILLLLVLVAVSCISPNINGGGNANNSQSSNISGNENNGSGSGSGGGDDGSSIPSSNLTLTLQISSGGEILVNQQPCNESPCIREFSSGSAVVIEATAHNGFRFDGYSGNCTGVSTCAFIMDSSMQVNAQFSAIANQPNPSVNLSLVSTFKSRGQIVQGADGGTISCLTPCPLFVDLTQTTSTHSNNYDSFADIGYRVFYGDLNAGNWEHSGQSKNIDSGGPLGFHLYENPGTYTVRAQARNPLGDLSVEHSITVRVFARDDVANGGYSQANTTIIRNSDGDWPTGFPQSNHRYLLEAGLDASSWGNVYASGVVNSVFEKYGPGADPILPEWNMESFNSNLSNGHVFSHNLTFIDLDALIIKTTSSHNDFTYVRGRMRRIWDNSGALGFIFEHSQASTRNQLFTPHRVALYEVNFDITGSNNNQYNATFHGADFVFAGCQFQGGLGNETEHFMRVWSHHRLLLQHNQFNGRTIHGQIKWHSGSNPRPMGYAESPSHYNDNDYLIANNNPNGGGFASQYGISRYNQYGDFNMNYHYVFGFGPQTIHQSFMRLQLDHTTNTFTRISGRHNPQNFNANSGGVQLVAAGGNAQLPAGFNVDLDIGGINPARIATGLHFVNVNGSSFQLSATPNGAPLNFSNNGDFNELWLVKYYDVLIEAISDTMSEFDSFNGLGAEATLSGRNIILRDAVYVNDNLNGGIHALSSAHTLANGYHGPYRFDVAMSINNPGGSSTPIIINFPRLFPEN